MRLLIAGSRGFEDYALLVKKLARILGEVRPDVVVSGGARGADRLGERWAKERGIAVRRFPADWERLGKRAGYVRNEEMAEDATHLVAFWDGKSRGTKHMIDIARREQLAVRIVRTDKCPICVGYRCDGLSDGELQCPEIEE